MVQTTKKSEGIPRTTRSQRAAAPSRNAVISRPKPSSSKSKSDNKEEIPAPPPAISSNPAKRSEIDSINTPPSQKLDIYVFGARSNGELGLGHALRNGKKPLSVQRPRLNDLLSPTTVRIVDIAVGGMHCVALARDNKIYTWGVNDLGALGRDTSSDASDNASAEDSDSDDDGFDLNPKESTPIAIPSDSFPKDTHFAQVVACDSASFALTVTGAVYGWGTFSGSDGVIGFTKAGALKAAAQKEKDLQRTPILLPELKNIKCLATGSNHVQALDHKGNVFIWGCGEQNELGRRIVDRNRALVPSHFSLSKRKFKSIACGAYHNFAIDTGNRVYAWGLNNFGQTGIAAGTGEDHAITESPTVVKSLQPYNIRKIEGGLQHSIACTDDQKVLVWGRCDDSQPGIPTNKLPQNGLAFNSRGKPRILLKPTIIPGLSAVSVAAGIDDSIALTERGEAYSWGFSSEYRTGQGTTETVELPTQIQNTALAGKKITFAGCGGQFGVLAGPALLPNGGSYLPVLPHCMDVNRNGIARKHSANIQSNG
ncbi:RCC1/BLIP-II [Stipitochalara longipes BDJ]|nr:RCC1/BLIP-II [Stipitochalara longipes BDJ]